MNTTLAMACRIQAFIVDPRTNVILAQGLPTCDVSSAALRAACKLATWRRAAVLLEDADGDWLVSPNGDRLLVGGAR